MNTQTAVQATQRDYVSYASNYLKTFTARPIRVDCCVHPSVITCTLWLFDGEAQVASISEQDDGRWLSTRMFKGSPYGQRRFDLLFEALEYAVG